MEQLPGALEGLLALPNGNPRSAVLVLAGSSGRIETDRVELLAAHGAAAMSIRWFGGADQPAGICEIPLESFAPALDHLAGLHDHLAVIGTSKGAEVALLLATRDPRIKAVAAMSPSSVVWANVGAGSDGVITPYRSSWTEQGRPLPFVPYDDDWVAGNTDRPSYRGLYEQSLVTFADRVQAATIPVEQIGAELLLTAGGDDQVWPSDVSAQQIVARRAQYGHPTRVATHPRAGHRVQLPGEPDSTSAGASMTRGGTPEADAQLGHKTWQHLTALLHLPDRPT